MYYIKSIFIFSIFLVLMGCAEKTPSQPAKNKNQIEVKTILLHNKKLIFSDVIIVPEQSLSSISRHKIAKYENDEISLNINAYKKDSQSQKAIYYEAVSSEKNKPKINKFKYMFDYGVQENTTVKHILNQEYEMTVNVKLIK